MKKTFRSICVRIKDNSSVNVLSHSVCLCSKNPNTDSAFEYSRVFCAGFYLTSVMMKSNANAFTHLNLKRVTFPYVILKRQFISGL